MDVLARHGGLYSPFTLPKMKEIFSNSPCSDDEKNLLYTIILLVILPLDINAQESSQDYLLVYSY